MSELGSFMQRTAHCGELRLENVDGEVTLNGWVNRRRDHGGLIFIDLRDRSGLVQVVFDPQTSQHAHAVAFQMRGEYVVAVRGTVRRRPEGTENPQLATGDVEVIAQQAEFLNPAETPPFSFVDETETDELTRMKYRYIDLRSPRMQHNLRIRHEAAHAAREFLTREGFWEVETPILFKATPEGARDYLVPSRVSPGNFYALPQSPQLLKQLLMVGGVEKYFQLARCLRDEDLRADRQPEHTQIDIEMSFVGQEDIFDLAERLFAHIFKTVINVELPIPFPRMTHAEAMSRYGTDKPDTRFGMELVDVSDIVKDCEFRVFSQTMAQGGQVKGIKAEGCAGYTRSQIDKLTEFAQSHKAQGLVSMAITEGEIKSPIAKFFAEGELRAIADRFPASPGDLLLIVADKAEIVAESLDWLRREMGRRAGWIDEDVFAPLWVTEFPLFIWNDEEKRWAAEHHPFCMPLPEDWELLETDPGQVRAQAYDVVLNGVELGSGSIRIHRRDIQQQIFDVLGIGAEEAERRFGFLLRAFEYGTPPHGGIAPGFDRLVMMLCGEKTIREVIAFPKTQRAQDLMSGAPSAPDPEALRELYIKLDIPPTE